MNTHPSIFTLARILALLGFFVLVPSGCDGGRPLAPTASVEGGQALITLGTIPDDVACVRVSIAGESRAAERDFDVAPGNTLTEALTGLPVGPVVFTASAYAQACDAVTKSTAPTWISEDKAVNLVAGKSSSVTLTLYRNGRAKVTVEFAEQDDGGIDAGSKRDASVGH